MNKKLDKSTQNKQKPLAKSADDQEQFSAFIEHLPAIVIVKDSDRNIIQVNKEAQEILELTPECFGHKLEEFLHEDSRQEIIEHDKQVLSTGSSVFELNFPDRKGRNRIFKFHKFSIKQNDELLIFDIALNITEQKEAESELHRQMILNEKIIQAANVLIVLLDENTDIILFNDGMEISGYKREEVLDENWLDTFVPEEDRKRASQFFDDMFQARKEVLEHENMIVIKNGSRRWIHWQNSLLKDDEEHIAAVLRVGIDVTERRKEQEELIQLATAVEQAAETTMITDKNGIIQYVNPVFEQLTGYSKQEAVGRSPGFLKSGKHDKKFYSDLWKTISSGSPWQGHFINKKKDGSLYEEEVVISPIRDTNGEIVNYVAVKRDVTQEIALENQLRQSQKMEAIGKLAGGVAHDFNNLLMVITNSAEFALESLPSESDVRIDIKQIIEAGKRASGLTQQLLAFSRRQRLAQEQVDLNVIITGIEDMLRRLIDENIMLAIEPMNKPVHVKVDRGQIEQVLVNLVVNARDAMPAGGQLSISIEKRFIDPKVTLEFAEDGGMHAGNYAVMLVGDTGIGMDTSLVSHIYEPFFTTKSRSQGTGLGLSTVYGIIKQHGGHIGVESKLQHGTIFTVYLPLVEDIPEEKSEDEYASLSHGNETILFVEDDPFVRKITLRMLRKLGYRVFEFSNGPEAISFARSTPETIHMLLTDVIMPEMDGNTLAMEIKKIKPEMKILFTSGYPDNYLSRKGIFNAGADLLKKPFSIEELAGTVRAMLDDTSDA